jgi:hypothetical protein
VKNTRPVFETDGLEPNIRGLFHFAWAVEFIASKTAALVVTACVQNSLLD